jgi:hypothetical protein
MVVLAVELAGTAALAVFNTALVPAQQIRDLAEVMLRLTAWVAVLAAVVVELDKLAQVQP